MERILIDCDEGVKELYGKKTIDNIFLYEKTDILLWCHMAVEDGKHNQPRKRSSVSNGCEPPPKRATCAQTLTGVEEIVTDLKAKHGSTYTVKFGRTCMMYIWESIVQMYYHQICHILREPNMKKEVCVIYLQRKQCLQERVLAYALSAWIS